MLRQSEERGENLTRKGLSERVGRLGEDEN